MSYSGTDVFANKIVYGECGSQFGKKVWDKSDRVKVLEIYINDLKASKNKLVDFDEAKTVFYDNNALYEYDDYHSVTEERFKIIGISYKE